MQMTFVKILNGTNYKDWVESLKLYLTITNLGLALHEEEMMINENSTHRTQHKKWTHFNKAYLMVIK